MSDLNALLGLEATKLSPAAAAVVAEAEARAAALEGRCTLLLALLNSELVAKGYAAKVIPTGSVVVEPFRAVG